MKSLPFAALTLPLSLLLAGCGGESDEGGDAATASPASAPANSDKKDVKLPDAPFFTDFAYPGAAPDDALTMGGATSVWFKTTDDFSKVTDFYSAKFEGGNNVVQDKRAYFALPNAEGGPRGATVTKQPDDSVQIILKLEHQ